MRKRQHRLSGMVLSLSARGLTHGELSAHLAEVYGALVSKQTISPITDESVDARTAALARVCMAPMSLDPTGKGRHRNTAEAGRGPR